jgi:hypothetical protein
MFDKNGAFAVATLKEVCVNSWIGVLRERVEANDLQLLPMSFGPEALPPPGSLPARG